MKHLLAGQQQQLAFPLADQLGLDLVEAALVGQPWTLATVARAEAAFATDFQPLTDWRAAAQRGGNAVLGVNPKLLVMVGGAVAIVILLGTPTISEAVIRQLGWAPWVDDVWNVVKWPVLAADLVVMVAVLYYATPNVKTPQLRWVSAGAAFAIVTWAIATVGFALYVETLGGWNRAYGWLGGAILLLVHAALLDAALVFRWRS